MSFSDDVRRFATKAEKATDTAVRYITLALFSGTVESTPVGDPSGWKYPDRAPPGYVGGRLKGNWQVSQSTPATGTLDTVDPSGRETIAKIVAGMGGLGSVTYLANNLPYAYRIEFDGWSKQAPAGMVRINFARINQHVRAAAAKARKG